jgi:4-hydroxybenzoate polyprenyltransferase
VTLAESREPRAESREGQTFSGAARLIAYVNLVKLPHTVFALPFALVGVVLASYRRPLRLADIGWVIVAFTAARFAAMAFNRIVDREFDKRNPRTAAREIPAGVLPVGEAWVSVVIACALFVFAAAKLNPLCLKLSPVAITWIFFYSFTKRFTRWSHLVLGWSLAIAPVGGYLAITGSWSRPWWMLIALAAGVACWVAGFDIFYALQDIEFDREQKLNSVPAAMGEAQGIVVARVLHVLAVAALAVVGFALDRGAFYWTGVTAAGALLLYEHSLVSPGNLKKLDAAFFTMNGMISITFFFFVLLDRVLQNSYVWNIRIGQ